VVRSPARSRSRKARLHRRDLDDDENDSPDFNPIENAFSKLKALLRKAAERTVDALWGRIGALLCEFAPNECANFFAAAGYEPD
jgi:hypothetical protein